MNLNRKYLAAKFLLVFLVAVGSFQKAQAGIPVIDSANLTENILSAIEAAAQTSKQIQQYQTQLQQYENQLQNTVAPTMYIWDQAQNTINELNQATNTLSYFKNQLGSLDAYLGKFQDVEYYKNSPCFTSAGCSDAEREAVLNQRELASKSQKKANDALFKGLEKQQDNLQADSRQLQRLQSVAQGADGQLEAIGYANQLASNQSNQLLQIRSLLIAQHNAFTAYLQTTADKEAQQSAASKQLRMGDYVESPNMTW
ncbi:P-type conjugative transfer protein TrbJ [Marinobacter sp.]|uniref:P-type conjugative transfer protein TrbJ n=1 Tax=Marinobacter sp. TaxID=50741 RepID=UPI003A8D4023